MLKKILIITLFLISPLFIFATEEKTFPKEEAGLSVYTKTPDINEENNTHKINEIVAEFGSLENNKTLIESENTHVIGKIPVEIKAEGHSFYIDLHAYIDKDGWIVIYLKKEVPSSKIIYWNNYTPGNLDSNILKQTLESVTQEFNLTYSSLNYYHFQYPEANRMSVIINTVNSLDAFSNSFSVTVPGKVHESSYSLYYEKNVGATSPISCPVDHLVDNEIIIRKDPSEGMEWCKGDDFTYDFYPSNTFKENKPHIVSFKDTCEVGKKMRMGSGTVILYEN